ncbi:SART-1 protein [Flammula alnicola]|nr:SART-1 protein [Flammula alnicola]
MQGQGSISLEETIKIRVSLGLKPLVDDAGPANDSDKLAEANYAKQRSAEAKQRESKKISDRIKKVRNRQALNAKLKGDTLGDGGEPEDTLQWVKKSKQREREPVKRRQEELGNIDSAIQDEYTERDLVGLKVSHDFEEMNAGEAKILTLKDSRILNDEEDELQNIEMAEDEQRKKKRDLKTKTRVYTGYDDEEFVAPGTARSVLAKYDEVIDGVQETGFRLCGGALGKAARADLGSAIVVYKSLLSIDYAKNIAISDYVQEGDIEFKKIKTKQKRPSRRTQVEADPDDNVGDSTMEIEDTSIATRAHDLNSNFVDNDELQAALARSRQVKISKTKKLSPEQIAAKVAAERALDEAEAAQEIKDEETSDGLMFDDTSEFIRSIQYNPTALEFEHAMAASSPIKQQPHDILIRSDEEDEDPIKAAEEAEFDGDNDHDIGTFLQQHHSSGMASTLSMLRQQGILLTPTADQPEAEQLQRDLWLAEQRVNLAQREMKKREGNGQNKDQATREYDNRVREQQEAKDRWDTFKDYKPLLNLTEYDEFGRPMTRKEAWKALSHKFHGKGSGKTKLEKRLKKIANEKKRETMASGDTPLGMNKAFKRLQEKAGQAHFVLSVGNRSTVPPAPEHLDPQPLTKGKSEKRLKKEEAKSSAAALAAQEAAGFMVLPAMQTFATTSPDPNGGSSAPKPGFSRISRSTVESGSTLQDDTLVLNDRTKVAFGFGTKRKAGELTSGTPPPRKL